MRVSGAVCLAIASVVCASQALSQDARPVQWHFNAGYSLTNGTTSDYLDDGWIVGGGVTWNLRPDSPFALRGDLTYSRYDATQELINLAESAGSEVRIDDGDGSIWGLTVNGVYNIPFNARFRGYLTAGIGGYYRKVELTQTALISGIYCDPWWGFCYPALVAGDVIVQDQTTTKFGWNAGLGVEFPMGGGGAIFIDARYQRIETQEPTEFIPIQIGYRF
jgi:opacity protein-like surface antigen